MTSQTYLLKQLKKVQTHFHSSNENVSQRGVDWHLDHSLRVICGIGKALIKSKPEDFKRNRSIVGMYILGTDHIPRGKGKAPKAVSCKEEIYQDQLERLFKDAESIWDRADMLPGSHFFSHPVIGNMKKETTKKFLKIHTRHHLKIIKNIVES